MSNPIDNSADTIDSRDIIERIEDLEGELAEPHGYFMSSFEDWVKNTVDRSEPVFATLGDDRGHEVVQLCEELAHLWKVAEQAEGYGDWEHGELLVRESHFTDYVEELIGECYEMPKDLTSGRWPYCHMTMDYEAAAEAAKADYTEIEFAGVTYLMRA